MANDVKFENYSIKVKKIIKEKCLKFLSEASALMVSQVQKNTAVKTGKLKRSWTFKINEADLESTIGSSEENSIWEEFGTGEYALNGNGRKDSWHYKDPITGKWYKTKGKKPKRAFYKAFSSLKNTIIQKAESLLKEIK